MLPGAPPTRAAIGPWISRGVVLVRERLGAWILLATLSLLPALAVGAALTAAWLAAVAPLLPRFLEGPDVPADPAQVERVLAVLIPVLAAAALVAGVLTLWLTVGLYRAALDQVDGEEPDVRDLGHLAELPRVLGAVSLAGAATALASLLCLVPGLIVAGRLQFAVMLAIDRGMSPVQSLRESWRATSGDTLGYTLHALAVGTLAGLGSYVCGVGLVFTWPLLFTATAAAYRDLFRARP